MLQDRSAQFSAQAQKFWILMKKASLGVRSPWILDLVNNLISLFCEDLVMTMRYLTPRRLHFAGTGESKKYIFVHFFFSSLLYVGKNDGGGGRTIPLSSAGPVLYS